MKTNKFISHLENLLFIYSALRTSVPQISPPFDKVT